MTEVDDAEQEQDEDCLSRDSGGDLKAEPEEKSREHAMDESIELRKRKRSLEVLLGQVHGDGEELRRKLLLRVPTSSRPSVVAIFSLSITLMAYNLEPYN